MSIDIRIDSYDIVDMDERLDRAFDIRNGWGTEAVGDDNIMPTENMGRFPQGSIHAVIQTQQAQIEDQQAQIEDQQALILDQQDKFDTMVKHIKQLEKTVHSVTSLFSSDAL